MFVGPGFGVLDRCVQVCAPYLLPYVGWRSPYTLLWHKHLKAVCRLFLQCDGKIFRPGSNELTKDWRRLRNEELHDLYSSPNITRVINSRGMRCAGYVERLGDRRRAYRILVGKPEGERPLGISRRRWEDNVQMDFQ